jgi:hypothetical protein
MYIEIFPVLGSGKELIAYLLRNATDLRLEARDASFGEKTTERKTAPFMEIMISSAES